MLVERERAEAAPSFTYNPEDAEYTKDPYPTYRYLRERAPAYHWASAHAWVFTRYHDVVEIMRDRRFSTNVEEWEFAVHRPESERSDYERLFHKGLFALPPEDHTRVRKLVSPAFTPRAIERMRGSVQQIVDATLADAGTELDIAKSFAESIPLRAISSIFDIPAHADQTFRRFGQSVVDGLDTRLTPEERARILEPFPAGLALLREIIAERRRRPGDDLLSALIAAQEDGDRLDTDELVSLVMALISAGGETTTHLICFATRTLLRHPDQLALLRADPTLLRNALDECLRFDNPGKNGLPRFVTEELQFRGVALRKGQLVYPHLPAALHDPEVFAEPERFDIRRDQHANVSFGTGPHHCIGAALARLEGQVAVGTLLTRFPALELAGETTFAAHPFLRKMSSLPVRLR
jgi:cytochrome P450 enzyme